MSITSGSDVNNQRRERKPRFTLSLPSSDCLAYNTVLGLIVNKTNYFMSQQTLKSFECSLIRVSLPNSIFVTLILYLRQSDG